MINRELRAFLCHASDDKPVIREIYSMLKQDKVIPWLDEVDILGGQNWDLEIRRAVRKSDVILVCLSSSSVGKESYIQKEIRFALDIADEKPEDTIFIIPIRLDDCEIPESLRKWQWIDYRQSDWHTKMIHALRERAHSLDLGVLPIETPIESWNLQLSPLFITYSEKDREFAKRLHGDLQINGVRCFLVSRDHELDQLGVAPLFPLPIACLERVILVLSENSVKRHWIEGEVEGGLLIEKISRKRPLLFPIRLDDAVLSNQDNWAAKIKRTKHLSDFSNWKDEASYQKSFEWLLSDVKATGE